MTHLGAHNVSDQMDTARLLRQIAGHIDLELPDDPEAATVAARLRDRADEHDPGRCEQCETCAPLVDTEYGRLCETCALRQWQFDERAETFADLSPATFGFPIGSDDYDNWGWDD